MPPAYHKPHRHSSPPFMLGHFRALHDREHRAEGQLAPLMNWQGDLQPSAFMTPLLMASALRHEREAIATKDRFDFASGHPSDAFAHSGRDLSDDGIRSERQRVALQIEFNRFADVG